jgi:6-pyruvoyltetrahydropterin/6-carboxytetrahydropterin synthase
LHGHTYRIDVTISGEPRDGMILDFADFKAGVKGVLESYDHGCWNDVLDYPSVENICALLAGRLREVFPFTIGLRVWEGHGKWTEL